MGAASATIAKIPVVCGMIVEGALDAEVSRLAVSVLGGVHAGIKGSLAMLVKDRVVRGSAAH